MLGMGMQYGQGNLCLPQNLTGKLQAEQFKTLFIQLATDTEMGYQTLLELAVIIDRLAVRF